MPRYLYLLRHAQSADKQHGQSDLDRELTPAGMRQSVAAGIYLRDQNIFPDIIYVSTAERARMTAEIVAENLKFDRDELVYQEVLYEASMRTLLNFIEELDDRHQKVLVVAHNPALSYVAEYLTKADIGEIMPAGMAIIQFNQTPWNTITAGSGEFVRYINF